MRFLNSFIILFLFVSCKTFGAASVPIVENGVLNLSNWDFAKDGIVKISDGSVSGLSPTYYDKENDSAEFYLKIILPESSNSLNNGFIAVSIPPIMSPYYFLINDNIELSNSYNYVAHWKVNYYDKSNILPVPEKKIN